MQTNQLPQTNVFSAGITLLANIYTHKTVRKYYPFESEARLNNIYEFSLYLKENTTLHHYKDQLVNAV
jgi:hypothetical protein